MIKTEEEIKERIRTLEELLLHYMEEGKDMKIRIAHEKLGVLYWVLGSK
jgi:hypothetical protein